MKSLDGILLLHATIDPVKLIHFVKDNIKEQRKFIAKIEFSMHLCTLNDN